MTAPSQIAKAQNASNRQHRTRQLARVMRHHRFGPDEGCTLTDLRAAGFTLAEIEAYRDDAMRLLRGSPPVVLEPSRTRLEGRQLVEQARVIRDRLRTGGR